MEKGVRIPMFIVFLPRQGQIQRQLSWLEADLIKVMLMLILFVYLFERDKSQVMRDTHVTYTKINMVFKLLKVSIRVCESANVSG